MMRLKSFFTLIFGLFVIALNAQDKLQIKGKVLSTTNSPIEFTTITLEAETEGVVMEGIADAKGEFILEVPAGDYVLIIEPLGYDLIQKDINLTDNVDLGLFTVKSSEVVSLGAAVITAEKPVYKVELDKKVYDMANDPMSQGQSLSDALQNVPSIQVDAEGNVSLRGNDNVKFLIDGKPSGMLGVSSVADALKNIPAENVERIELITNPSARYEASGSAGIVNIVLKKGTNTGFNGSVTVNGGIPEMAGVNVNLNYKTKKWNWYTNVGSRYSNRNGEGGSFLTRFDPETKQPLSYRSTTSETDRIRRNYNIRFGTEYYLDNKNTLGVSAGYRYNNGNNDSYVNYLNYDGGMNFKSRNFNILDEKELENNFDVDFNYKHEFDTKGHEFVFTGRYSTQKEEKDGFVNNYGATADEVLRTRITDNLEKQNTAVLTADYVRPIGEKGKFELGARADFNNNKSDNRTYNLINGNLSNDTDFFANIDNQQNVYAGYVQYGNAIGKLQYFAGLRLESSDMDIKFVDLGSSIKKTYTDLFPSATLNYTFNEKNELQLSYSKRVRRPMGFMLNPFFSPTDDVNIRYGNPDLNPTYTNSLELSYITNIGKLMVTPSIFYQQTTDVINQFQRKNYNDAGQEVFITRPVNAGDENRYGLDLTATYRPFKWWNLMANINLFGYERTGYYQEENTIKDPETGIESTKIDAQNFSGDGFSSRGRLSSNFTLPADFKLQLAANYMGGIETAQQKVEDNLSMDLSVSKDLFNKKATLSFNIRDVFDSRQREVTQFANDYTDYGKMRWMVRSYNLSFTYRFKNTQEPKEGRGKKGQKPNQRQEGEEIGGEEMGGGF